MATPAFFGKGFLQFGRESTWGTEVNATKRIPCTVLDIQAGRGKIRSQAMDGKRVRSALSAGGHRARAVIEIEMQYVTGNTDPSGFLMIQDWIHGTGTFGNEGFASSGSYTHTFTIGDYQNSLTLEMGDGAPGGDADCVLMVGAKVVEAAWTWGASYDGDNNRLKLRLTVVGKSVATNTAITAALTAQTDDPIMSHHCTIADGYGGSTGIWDNITVTYRTGIIDNGHYVGSQYIREPVAADFASCEIEMVGDHDAWTHMDALLNHTVTSGEVNFTFSKPSDTEQYVLKVLTGKAYVVEESHPLTNPGIVKRTVRFETIKDGNDGALVAQIVTTSPSTEG